MARNGDWMQTYTGRQFWPIDPRPDEVHIEDIAHALSMMCRYNGPVPAGWGLTEPALGVEIVGWSPWLAEQRFLARYEELTNS